MTTKISFDFRLALSPAVKGGIEPARLQELAADSVGAVGQRSDLGFWTLPERNDFADLSAALGKTLREEFEHMVVIGIGGSSLGGQTIKHALCANANVHFWDNIDPHTLERELSTLDLEKTCFNVVSKSGGTIETAALYALIRDRLRELSPTAHQTHVVATTDPKDGILRALANEEGLRTLPIPADVGGRFSVLTPVGLLPAAFAGVSPHALLEGAKAMKTRCSRSDNNPALYYAGLHHALDTESDRRVHVLMPYCDRLTGIGAWHAQLWAESLGKRISRGGEVVHTGPTPQLARGATDQHSQVQLYVEGRDDKIVTFFSASDNPEVSLSNEGPEAYTYLRGRSFDELLKAELKGTQLALARAGRPSVHIEVERVDAHALGGLFFFFEAATAFAGELYDINAFDQPGVEDGKRIALALMGREGYADALAGTEVFDNGPEGFVL